MSGGCADGAVAICAAAFLAVLAATVLPFAAVAPGGVWDSVWRQAGRPLQIESLGAGLLLAAHHLFGLDLTMESSHGSQNLAGTGAEVLGVVSTLLQAALVIAIWVWYARGPASATGCWRRARWSARSSPSGRCSRRSF